MLKTRLCYGVVLAVFALPLVVRGQEQRLSITGTFSTGYYGSTTSGEVNQSLRYVPFGAKFDMSGYFVSPDIVSFTATPELTLGPQASEAGFSGGNGIRLNVTFLRRSIIPLTFHYSNVQVEDVYFGSLTQVSGYTLKSRNKELGVTWEIKPHGLPSTVIDFGTSSVDSQPGVADIADYLSSGNHLNVNTKYERWGWDLDGFVHRLEQNSNLLSPTGGTNTSSLQQTLLQYQGSARRSFLQDSELFVDAGSQSTSNLLFTLPVDLTTHYVSANLRLRQRRRWKTSLRANYSSNLSSQLLALAANSLTGPGSVTPAANILTPFSNNMSSYNVNGVTSLTLSHGFGLFGSLERGAIISSNQEGPLSADYFAISAGMTYGKMFHWGSLSGEYSREFGIGSVTGQSGTIQGDNYTISAQRGRSGGLVFDATIHGSDQSVHNTNPLSNNSFSVEGSVANRLYQDFNVRIGGGWQWGSIVNGLNEFRTNGYTARASIDHPKIQISAAINNSLSDSLPFYNQVLSGAGVTGPIFVSPLQIIPSDFRALNFTVHTNPMRKLEISAFWTHSVQHLDGFLNNNFQLLNVYLTYHFRRLQLEAGFIRSNQVFAYYPYTLRERLYIKVSRTARLL